MPASPAVCISIPFDSPVWDVLRQCRPAANQAVAPQGVCDDESASEANRDSCRQCVYCGQRRVALLDGLMTCRDCCSVVDRLMDYGAEWRFFCAASDGGAANGGRNMTRCCPPSSSLVPVLGSVIGGGVGGSKSGDGGSGVAGGSGRSGGSSDVQKYHFWNSMTYKERTLCSVFEQLSSIALRNGIPHIILEEAKGLYKRASSVRVTRGDNRKAIIACSMYMACKLNNVPRNTKEIGELFGVKNNIVTRGCKLIQELIAGLEVSSSRPEDYIRRFSSKLNMDEAERAFTLEIVRRAEEHEIACEFMPTSVAAGALMMTNVELQVGLQRADIAHACYLSESTMLKCYKRLNQHKELLM